MARDLIKPKKLKQGGTIALIAPSSWCEPESSAETAVQLEKMGYRVFVHPQCLARDYTSAGTAADKVAALHDVFADKKIDAVFALRGGYRALHMLDKIDYDLIRANPKIFMGYSDITTLHGAFLERARMVTFHGPTANGFRDLNNSTLAAEHKSALSALEFLNGTIPGNLFRDAPVQTIQNGAATGVLWGGCLQLLDALIAAGSRYCPPLDKTILVIEDIGEEIAKLDTQLGAWRLRGVFKNLAGLVVGGMTDVKDTPGRAGPFTYTITDIVRQHTADMKGPVVMGAPFGHLHPNYVFPEGCMATLTADKKKGATLSLTESPFADG